MMKTKYPEYIYDFPSLHKDQKQLLSKLYEIDINECLYKNFILEACTPYEGQWINDINHINP